MTTLGCKHQSENLNLSITGHSLSCPLKDERWVNTGINRLGTANFGFTHNLILAIGNKSCYLSI